jgi:DNA-binding GntR family transcriptional regulator
VASDPSGVVAAFEAVLALQAGKREFTTATWADLAKRMPPAAIAGLRAAHARLEEARFGGVPMAWSELEQALAQARIR